MCNQPDRRRRVRRLIIICMLTMLWQGAGAQEVTNITLPGQLIRLSYWRESHGLPSWHIRDIVNDRRGMVWLATDVGLVSLDGKRFTRHPVEAPGVGPQDLRRIAVDGRQNLWLFYRSADTLAIHVYNPREEQTVTAEAYAGRRMRFSIRMAETLFAREGRVWLLDPATGAGGYYEAGSGWVDVLRDTSARGLHTYYFPGERGHFWKLDLDSRQVREIRTDGTEHCRCDFTDWEHDTNFRAGGRGALYLVRNQRDARGAPVTLAQCDAKSGLMPVDTAALPWLDWGRGLPLGFTTLPLRANNRQGVELVLHLGGLEVWSGGRPLYRELAGYLEEEHRLRLENGLYVLDDGSFWLYAAGALIRLEVLPNYFTRYLSEHIAPMSTRGMAVAGGTLYVNSYHGHLAVDLRSGRSRHTDAFNPYRFGMGMGLWNGKVWRGHHGNVVTVYDPRNDRSAWYPVESAYWSEQTGELYFTPSGGVYFGTEKGLFRLDRKAGAFRLWEMGDRFVYGFYRNAAGVWAGTSKGLALLDGEMRLQRNFSAEIFGKGKTPAPVKHVHEDAEGIFWLATDQGLWRWKPFSQESEAYDVARHGLPSDRLHAVYEDRRKRLWIPSDEGLICWDKQTERFHTYTSADGLPHTEMNALSHCLDSTGRLYVGGIAGVAAFYPDSIPNEPYGPPRLGLLSVKLHNANRETNLTEEALRGGPALAVPAGTDHLVIEFCVLDFSGHPVGYRWRIPERDSAWFVLDDPRIDLFHPPYGRYKIEIEARRTGNNLTQPSVIVITVDVQKPYYLQIWFIAAFISAIAALVALYFRQRQRQLLQQSRQLGIEVAEKTAQLQQERDVIARQAEALRQLDSEKSRFFQDLSHEIRNPLSLIVGPAGDMLKDGSLSEKQKERLQRIRRNAQKILQLIEELLELTKLEAGVVPIDLQPLDPADLVERICQDFEVVARQKGIEWRLEQRLPATAVRADKRKLEKILTNLLQNALKFTPPGGTVTVEAGYNEQRQLLLTVRDTGAGIAPENLERIFDRYYQAPNGRRTEGFGIGLSICRSYARLLGGDVGVSSELGRGAAFFARIPCAPAAAPSPAASQALPGAPSGDLPAGSAAPCILLVEDDAEVRAYVAGLLSPAYSVLEAGEGEQAAGLIRAQKVDLVISDIAMPGWDGLELLARLHRETGVTERIPLMFLTGSTARETWLEARRLGAAAYLTKPVDEQELLDTVRRILEQTRKEPGHGMY